MQCSDRQKEGIDQYVVLEGEGVILVRLLLLLPSLSPEVASNFDQRCPKILLDWEEGC
jgi:hypothetical protein